MTFEEKLAQAFEESVKERSERLMKIEKKHRFSLSYKLWERQVLRDLRKGRRDKHRTLKRARHAVFAIAAAVMTLIGGTAYAAFRFGRYGFEDNKDYSKIFIANHPSDKTTLEEYYGLPEEDGWKLTEYDITPFSSTLIYKRGDTRITLVQSLIHTGNMGHISTDRAKVEPMSLYEEDDGFILNFGDEASIFWICDGYLLQIEGNIDKNEAIVLAHSTKIVNYLNFF